MSEVRRLLADAAARIDGDEARADAERLLAHALGHTRAWLYARPEHVPDAAQRARFAELVAARARGVPIAYLTGRRAFWSFELGVTPAVLIPRPETERLVELALARLPAHAECAVADLGTGSGAVALALAHERPRARVLATDASADALAVARANAERLGLANVEFAQGDWCAALGARRFDLIASNPPYVAAGDAHLARGDLRFEPAAALASSADGLDAIRAIAAAAPEHLMPGGWLLVEHGFDQGARVRALFAAHGLRDAATHRDLEGRERVTSASMPS